MEHYIPCLLSERYSEWKTESLDGFRVANVKQIESNAIEIYGMAIIISDRSSAPFCIRLSLASSCELIAAYQILFGEPGGSGRLGISGSKRTRNLMETRDVPLEGINWAYRVTSDGV